MNRVSFRDVFGGLFSGMGATRTRTPTNPTVAPVSAPGPVQAGPDTPNNPLAGTMLDYFTEGIADPVENAPVAATAPIPDPGSNQTPNEQTWSQPNADTAAYTEDAGFGRTDTPIGSSGTQASGYVRTNISPGTVAGGVSTVPTPMRLPGETVKVMPGDTLKTLAQRSMGDPSFWPRLHVVQNDYVVPGGASHGEMVLKAGSVLELGNGG